MGKQIKIIKKYFKNFELICKIKWLNKQIIGIKTKKIYLSNKIGSNKYPYTRGIKYEKNIRIKKKV